MPEMPEDAKKKMVPDLVRFPLVLGIVCIASGASLSWLYGKTEARIKESEKRKLEAAFVELVPGYSRNEPKTVEIEQGGAFTYYRLLSEGGDPLGYGCETPGKDSYNSMKPIRAVTVIAPDLQKVRLLGMRVSFSAETPGLGERIKEKPAANSILGMLAGRPERVRIESPDVPVPIVRRTKNPDGSVTVEYDLDGEPQRKTLKKGTFKELEFVPWFQGQFTGLGEDDLKLKKEGGKVDAITGATVSSKACLNAVRGAVSLLKKHAK